ncbi:MAG: hypothetical protein IPM29_08405 [Planctomycetes bacterium]|nr:hypothetical protein [Planctomycetota bacterium]
MFRSHPALDILPLVLTAVLATAGHAWSQDFATFLGGTALERIMAVAVDDQDRIVVVGYARSSNFPVTTGSPFQGGSDDAFVTLIDPSRSGAAAVVFSRFLGGSGDDAAFDVEYSPANGCFVVVGCTTSTNFPTTPGALQGANAGGRDGFVTQLDPAGQILDSTYLGTPGTDRLGAVAVDRSADRITVAGFTDSAAFPTTPGVFQPSLSGSFDAIVAQLDPSRAGSAQLVAATYLGGSGEEGLFRVNVTPREWDLIDLHVAANGETTVASLTYSTNLPTTSGAYDRTLDGSGDAFVSRLDTSLGGLLWSTYLGGNANDFAIHLAVDAGGIVTVGGGSWVGSPPDPFPTTAGAPQSAAPGAALDGFLARLDPSRTGAAQLVYSTLLGGSQFDIVWDLAVEPSGIITACGQHWDIGGVWNGTRGAPLPNPLGLGCGFVLRLDPQGNGWNDVHYFSYVGAGALQTGGYEGNHGVVLRPDGRVVLTGGTDNPSHPVTANAPWPGYAGGTDATVLVLDLLPGGVTRYGAGSPGCREPAYMQVNSQPWPGNRGFEMLCEHAPATTTGALFVGAPTNPPVPLWGLDLLLVPGTILDGIPACTNATGFARLTLPVPISVQLPLGLGFQWWWLDPTACAGTPLAASDALRF